MTVRDPIEYLLNSMELAAQADKPAEHGYGQKRKAVLDAICELRERAATPSSIVRDAWISVEDRMPEPGTIVLAHYANRRGKSRTTRAMHCPRYTVSADDWEDVDFAEMNEEVDRYWWPEGWWEMPVEIEQFDRLDGTVTHWMPLPAAPTTRTEAEKRATDTKGGA